MQLSEREKVILEALVGLHVSGAGPVSSLSMQRELGLDVSSATIRNVLHGLEEKGLLWQPHTSAGRVPTLAGYRAFVDQFCRPTRLPEPWERRIRVELQLERRNQDVHAVLERVSRLLAELSSNVGVGMALEEGHQARVDRIDIIGLEGAQLLAVVTLDDGHVRTEIVPLENDLPGESLDEAARVLNEIVAGHTPAEARRRLDAALQYRVGAGSDIARRIAREKERVFADRPPPALHVEGASEIVQQPEFTDPENLRLLVRILDHPESLESVLLERGRPETPSVTIGVESEREELRPFSLVVSAYSFSGLHGYVGILGPMRMRYALAMTLVSGVAAALGSVPEPQY